MQKDPYSPRTIVTSESATTDKRTKHRLRLNCDGNTELDDRFDSRRLLTVSQVSELLSISPSMVYELIRAGKLRATNLGPRLTRVKVQDLDRYIQDCQDSELR